MSRGGFTLKFVLFQRNSYLKFVHNMYYQINFTCLIRVLPRIHPLPLQILHQTIIDLCPLTYAFKVFLYVSWVQIKWTKLECFRFSCSQVNTTCLIAVWLGLVVGLSVACILSVCTLYTPTNGKHGQCLLLTSSCAHLLQEFLSIGVSGFM